MSRDYPYYVKDGKLYWRLTKVLGTFRFPDDYPDTGDKGAMRAAGKLGDHVHGMIERHALDGKVVVPKKASVEVQNAWDAYMLYRKDHPVAPAYIERTIYVDQPYPHAFTVDWEDLTYAIDWKTSMKLLMRHRVQVAVQAAELKKVPRLVRLDKNLGDYQVLDVGRGAQLKYLGLFYGLLTAYHWSYGQKLMAEHDEQKKQGKIDDDNVTE